MPHRQQHVTRREHERQDVHRQGMGLGGGGASCRRDPREKSQVSIRLGATLPMQSHGAPRLDETGSRGSSVGKGKGCSGAGGGPGVWTTQRNLTWGLCLLHRALGSHGRFLSRDGS